MLFGKSLFQSVIDRLAEEADDEGRNDAAAGDDGHALSFRIQGLGTAFVPETLDASVDADPSRLDAYLDVMKDLSEIEASRLVEQQAAPQAEPEPPAWLDRLSLEEIAADIAITPNDNRETLQDKRRSFARDNHPDRVDDRFAAEATTRMKIANLLIDEALRNSGR